MHMNRLQTDTEVTTRQIEGGSGSRPMPGDAPQITFRLKAFGRGSLAQMSRESLGNAACSPIRAARSRRPTPIGVGVSLKWTLVEPVSQAFEGPKTHTAVVLGGSPKTLYNKLNGCARDTAFSNS